MSCPSLILMETHENDVDRDDVDADGVDVDGDGVAELQLKVETLRRELLHCRAELAKLHKQLSHSERLQKTTENYNEDLRKQVGWSLIVPPGVSVICPSSLFDVTRGGVHRFLYAG